jgi:hypothetical protein
MRVKRIDFKLPKPKKDIRVTIKLDSIDDRALTYAMLKHGETNASRFIRKLIHESAK